MARTIQEKLFTWQEVESSSEILRLRRVLESLPDRALVETLERERRGRHDEYPVRAIWNSVIAGIIFQHPSIASLIRELKRNGELRQVCGFDPLLGEKAIPVDYVYSRFLKKLVRHSVLVEQIFATLVQTLVDLLPDYGVCTAVDSKAVPTYRRHKDQDARWGEKTTRGVRQDGTPWEKTTRWFGYKLHLFVDTRYELPIAYEVTQANVSDTPRLMPLVENTATQHPQLIARTQHLAADRGYDDGKDKATLWEDYHIIPLMDIRDMSHGQWQPLDPQQHDTIYYSGTGEVCCKTSPFEADDNVAYTPMQYQGFEKERNTLKFRCPAAAFGIECKNQDACHCGTKDQGFGRVVRIPLDRDRRLFLPIYRHSNTFKQHYKKRTAVERVNSRFDLLYGFEKHTIWGLKKMTLRVGLALAAMLATAVAWIKAGKISKLRSLLQAA